MLRAPHLYKGRDKTGGGAGMQLSAGWQAGVALPLAPLLPQAGGLEKLTLLVLNETG